MYCTRCLQYNLELLLKGLCMLSLVFNIRMFRSRDHPLLITGPYHRHYESLPYLPHLPSLIRITSTALVDWVFLLFIAYKFFFSSAPTSSFLLNSRSSLIRLPSVSISIGIQAASDSEEKKDCSPVHIYTALSSFYPFYPLLSLQSTLHSFFL